MEKGLLDRGNSTCKARFILVNMRAPGSSQRQDVSVHCRNDLGLLQRKRVQEGIWEQGQPGERH